VHGAPRSTICFVVNDLHAQRQARPAMAPLLAPGGRVHATLASLLGSRFQDLGHDTALDLATGGRVWIVRRTLDVIGQAVWPREVDKLAALWHPAIAPCVDFGWTPHGDWFEAYAVDGREDPQGGTAAAFLAAHGVNCVLVRREMGPASPLVPALPDDPAAVRLESAGRGMGLRLVPRGIERAIATAIAEGRLGGPLVWSIDAPRGSGWRTTWRRLARHARQCGYVPIDAGVLESPRATGGTPGSWLAALSGTPLVVVFEQSTWHTPRRIRLAHLLVRLGGLDTPSTIVLDVVRMGRPREAPHRLEAIAADVLADALWVPRGCSPHWLRARRTAVVTGGQPGLFVEAIARRLGLGPPPATVHERPEVFGESAPAMAPERASAALRRAADLVKRGRSAAADRHLARTTSAWRRRGGRDGQALLLAARSEMLGARGDLVHSRQVWREACRLDAGAPGMLEAAARLAGQWSRHGALRDAHRVLQAALAAARVLDLAPPPAVCATLAYVHAWQARWRDALAVAAASDHSAAGRVWPALELGDVAAASEHLGRALAATGTGYSRWAQVAQLRLHVAVRDIDRLLEAAEVQDAADDEVGDEQRLLPIEGLVRHGVPLSNHLRRRLRAWVRPSTPRLARARARLALAVDASGTCHPPASLVEEVSRVVHATGARALAYGESRTTCWRHRPPEALPMLNDLVAILRACQRHDDPRAALADVARLLRERVDADSVLIFGRTADGDRAVAAAGGQDLEPVARRVLALAAPLAEAGNGVADAGAPVMLGTATVGAIAVRWVMSATAPTADARALLDGVATAVAPTVRVVGEMASTMKVGTESSLLGSSAAMVRVRTEVEMAARTPFTVLVEGESGSGKELVAREIHRLSPRKGKAFCAVNCAALTDELCEAELFGHARGAFTGAVGERPGLFEEADGGTLFLDEVSELSPRAQAKLLRAIQEGEIRRLGEARPRRVDVRLVAATNRSLAEAVTAGAFRADLRYRLDVIHITVPPLRARPEDVPLLAQQFWGRAIERVGSRAQLAADAVTALARYDWPGNVRELQNALAALAAQAPQRGLVRASALPGAIVGACGVERMTLEQARRMTEERVVREALAHAGGHRGRAATALGLTRQGLAKLVERLQLDAGARRPGA
jgi:two-component system response regulator AtoC